MFNGQALVAELINPAEVVLGGSALFSPPKLVDMNDRGIRAMNLLGREIIIISSAETHSSTASIYKWDGVSSRVEIINSTILNGYNPEAVTFFPDEGGGAILILSDDGSTKKLGRRCKDESDDSRKSFRGILLNYPDQGLK